MSATFKLVSALLLLVVFNNLWAADNTVFGIALGAPFSIPECEKKVISGGSYGSVWYSPPKTVCFERTGPYEAQRSTAPVTDGTVFVKFPLGERPALMSGGSSGSLSALVIDSRIEGFSFRTSGLVNQDEVLESLKQKYGEPTTFARSRVQSRMGASYETFDALWSLPEILVAFHPVGPLGGDGIVDIFTKRGAEHRASTLRSQRRDPNPL